MAVGREVRATVLVGAVGAEDWEQIKLMAAAQGAVGADGVEIHAALIKVMVGGKPLCCVGSGPGPGPPLVVHRHHEHHCECAVRGGVCGSAEIRRRRRCLAGR